AKAWSPSLTGSVLPKLPISISPIWTRALDRIESLPVHHGQAGNGRAKPWDRRASQAADIKVAQIRPAECDARHPRRDPAPASEHQFGRGTIRIEGVDERTPGLRSVIVIEDDAQISIRRYREDAI